MKSFFKFYFKKNQQYKISRKKNQFKTANKINSLFNAGNTI